MELARPVEMVLAHGVGGRQDLPIPFEAAVAGAAVALVVSFAALGFAWREPRLAGVPSYLGRSSSWVPQAVGLVVAAYFCVGLLFGPDTPDNPTAGVFYVLFWVGLVPLSLVFGPIWRNFNPLRTLHRLACALLRRDPDQGWRRLSPRVGYWPATAGLLAFVWLELVAPDRATLPVISLWLALYVVATLTGAAIYGAQWFDKGDAFEAYSTLIGSLSPITRVPPPASRKAKARSAASTNPRSKGGKSTDRAKRAPGTRSGNAYKLAWRNPLDGMAGLAYAPGLPALVIVLLGSTMYDSVSNAPVWVQFVQESDLPAPLMGTFGLLAVIGLVLALFLGATTWAARLGGATPATTAGELAHSLVPIAVGYLVAHYFTLFLFEGQHTLALLSDPLDTGANWLGTANWTLQSMGATPASIAMLQVTVIVIGHVLGTVLAHDRALTLFPHRTAVVGQIPLMALMVIYTVAGLLFLFAT
ncbi:hypothetical protein Aph01nite_04790 [Acrocarpospora phusangensis]|uniref:Fenitrothion hydrolase n=1 Tax=Acrocarpospora phusangensis TaxID=1070424 RepID=A0A919Q4G0_9ACTN|nr:hypothetical protein [Acrocarpospora phusangensis]GIH22169.1 hypothetical protein Aph01nite_04790 [Acrocarpospora phusangensis]